MAKANLLLLAFILLSEIVCAQKYDDDISAVAAIESYKDCNALCFEKSLIGDDLDTYWILNSFIDTKKHFKELFSNLDPSMPDLSAYCRRIRTMQHDTIWNKMLVDWASNVDDRNSNCLGYKLSIARPVNLSSVDDKLVIITAYKYDKPTDQYDAFVFFYNVKKIDNNWRVCGTDNVYEIMDDWRVTGSH